MSGVICSNTMVLKALNELAGFKARGQQREPTWFHPIPARMPLSVAEHLIERITRSEAVVLDPMAGSGTTLIAARRLRRKGMGFDRDPLSVLIAQSATHDFDSDRLDGLRVRVLKQARNAIQTNEIYIDSVFEQLPEEDQTFIEYWFPKESQQQLLTLKQAIDGEIECPDKDFAWVVFSSLIVAKSAGASHALDISRSRPHKRLEKPVVKPFDGWDRRFKCAIKRLPFLDDGRLDIESVVQLGDARALPVEEQTVDFVLTSPPYFNAIDYLRGHKFSLIWMGNTLEKLRELRGTMVGTERGLWQLDGLPSSLEHHLDQAVEKGRRRAQVRRYLSDIYKVLGEIERVLKPGGLALLVVGSTIINEKRTDAEEIVSMLGESAGLYLVGSVVRRLNATWRSLPPPGNTNKHNFLANRMSREVIVALRK